MEDQHPYRYNNPIVGSLLKQLQEHRQTHEINTIKKIKEERKIYHSMSLIETKRNELEERKLFNNKTKEGGLLDNKIKPVPYLFIPKYKNDTFIMPDRVFAKGKAAKRFHVKMKDTAIYSFRQPQSETVAKALSKEEKEKTILSRKVEEYNRVVDVADGVKRANHNTWCLRHRKQFNYARTGSELFSQCEPLLEPKEKESVITRKVSLAKTYDFNRNWRPVSRTSTPFDQTFTESVYNHHPHHSSMM